MSGNGDYISREAAIEDICSRLNWSDLEGNPIPQKDIRAYIADLINHVPAADVRPVVRGKWTISEHEYLDCSVCGYSFYTGFDTTREAKEYLESGYTPTFCSNCGADMRPTSMSGANREES